MTDAIDKRMFYLMLSPIEGQEIANKMGFSVPSEDVQKMEIIDVMSRWALLHSTGIYNQIIESVDWFSKFLVVDNKINSSVEDFETALTVFAISMLNKMVEEGSIALLLDNDSIDSTEIDDDE